MKTLTTKLQLKQLDGTFATVDAARKAFNKRFKFSDVGSWQFIPTTGGYTVVAEVAVLPKGAAKLDSKGNPLPTSSYYQDTSAQDVADIDDFDDVDDDDDATVNAAAASKKASFVADVINKINWN